MKKTINAFGNCAEFTLFPCLSNTSEKGLTKFSFQLFRFTPGKIKFQIHELVSYHVWEVGQDATRDANKR